MIARDHAHASPRLWLAAALLTTTLLAFACALAAPAARAGTASDMTTALAGADGTTGWLVKRGGPSSATTLAAKNDTFVFEPASSITFLHQLAAQLRIQADPVLANALTQAWVLPPGGSCPVIDDSPGIFFGDPLKTALSKMLVQSDNASVEAVRQFVGPDALNATAQALGATKTLVRHRHGCGSEALAKPDRLTLADAAKLYRAAFSGDLLTQTSRQAMWARMPTAYTALKQAAQDVSQEQFGQAPPVAFVAGLKSVYKSGHYKLCSQAGCKRYIAGAGYAEIPWKSIYGVAISLRYTFGFFVHGTTISAAAAEDAKDRALRAILRAQIAKALGSWL